VIYSSAYALDKNPELIEATKRGIPCIMYPEVLGAISFGAWSCGIAGVHGKTSTTAICGTILEQLDIPVQVLAGSLVTSFSTNGKKSCAHGSCTLNKGYEYFIAETCEYQRHFMNFHPDQIILSSVESDHQDYYPTYESILDAFVDYCCLLPVGGKLIYCADDTGASETAKFVSIKRPDILLVPYGFTAQGDFSITNYSVQNGMQAFSLKIFANNKDFELFVPGKHNVLNAAACIALVIDLLQKENLNVIQNFSNIHRGLKNFTGSRRRSEIIYDNSPYITIIDDYGHHPTEIQKTLTGLRQFYKDRYIIIDFMSHTYTRTAALLEEFAQSFGAADMVVLNKIYSSAREKYSGTVTGKTLYNKTKAQHFNVVYAPEFDEASIVINKTLTQQTLNSNDKKGFLVVTMGAGDNWKVGTMLCESLKDNIRWSVK
ncbi:MAG TPA: Mur ligase family protein, partial [Treponemataceae bacterium]|nr:Mur ligase family protein [Treponemataceae bacterium]